MFNSDEIRWKCPQRTKFSCYAIFLMVETYFNLQKLGCCPFWGAKDASEYGSVLLDWEIFIKMRATLIAPTLPWVMKGGGSKQGNSHFNETRKKVFKAILASDCYHCIACFFWLFPAFIASRPKWLEQNNKNKKKLQCSLVNWKEFLSTSFQIPL